MKKGLKIGLIVGGSLLIAWGAWTRLTKACIIPNRFGIKVGCTCVDCHGKFFYEGEPAKKNQYDCCEGTYLRGMGLRDMELEGIKFFTY